MPIFFTNGPKGGSRGRRGGGGSATIDAAIQALIDGLLDSGEIDLYDGTPPRSTLNTATGSTFLTSFTFAAAAAPIGGLLSPSSITLVVSAATDYVATTGTQKWARIRKADGSVLADVSVGLSGSGADLIIASNTIALAQVLTLSLVAHG